ncbi:4-amino-4-deoxy-L-arabinose-phosphoundecaprenol flippase subunit ArnF [Paraferrimonas sedimenticola]|uniref:4-amino-4-deoxy-L-arabinose-phosphoundecaprenol flippase subunit ArnF n=1 Tax=Paraferrimonas sedimenticola TaxID=375674 RepID=A0AA37RXD1_9GAMM|nr:4-amino-4-deoxy-L-arabinose-phosphoundecaprenol flippase subunit ArnF [Paraferrimonas sedimenticola]GLP97415.1 putative 4-amino-4-deoxy-L-arabinose-phosphoundecaprenol flippase subunit ArnF [Paraferrimonas sedimenticola]
MSASRGYAFALASIALVSFAQLAMKWGMSLLPAQWDWLQQPALYTEQLGAAAWVLAGLLAYLGSMAAWMGVLANLPLSKAYPMLGISYALVYLIAVSSPWFEQTYSHGAAIGIGLILVGVGLCNAPDANRVAD